MALLVDLAEHFDFNGVQALNIEDETPIDHAIRPELRDNAALSAVSDADEQMLIVIPFMNAVKLHSIVFRGPPGAGPATVKLFKNRLSFDFDDAEREKPSDVLQVQEAQLGSGSKVALKFVNFQMVTSIAILIDNNQGGEEQTILSGLTIFGMPVGGVQNVDGLKKC